MKDELEDSQHKQTFQWARYDSTDVRKDVVRIRRINRGDMWRLVVVMHLRETDLVVKVTLPPGSRGRSLVYTSPSPIEPLIMLHLIRLITSKMIALIYYPFLVSGGRTRIVRHGQIQHEAIINFLWTMWGCKSCNELMWNSYYRIIDQSIFVAINNHTKRINRIKT